MYYKNVSTFTKTFYGVAFAPGEIKEVPGFINDMKMIKTEAAEAVKPEPKAKVVDKKDDKKSAADKAEQVRSSDSNKENS